MAKNVQTKTQAVRRVSTSDPTELKNVVRDGLVGMTMPEREEFIKSLEAEMARTKLHVRAYLIPLGIPARSPEELTPTEVGHLIRFLVINVPASIPAIQRTFAKYPALFEQQGHPLAA